MAGRGVRSEVRDISRERWWELYWAPESGHPSTRELAERFGVNYMTVVRAMKSKGVRLRTQSEQRRASMKSGRWTPPAGNVDNFGGKRARPNMVPALRAKIARALERSVEVPCGWCGEVVERKPHRLRQRKPFCSRVHSGKYTRHMTCRPDEPRPLIVDRLWQLTEARLKPLRERDRQGVLLANSYEHVERVGQEIGAREPEILAVLEKQGLFG